MKNRLYLVGGVLLVAAALAGLLWWEQREPVYEGKPLGYWLTYQRFVSWPEGWETATLRPSPQSLLKDTNAVPFLIRRLRPDPRFGAAFYRKSVWPKLPPWARTHLPRPTRHNQAKMLAAELLGRMGPIAKPAIPALIRALNEDDDGAVRKVAALALGSLGANDIAVTAALTKAMEDRNIREDAARALLKLDPVAAAKAGVNSSSP